jgi:hypothetical protein
MSDGLGGGTAMLAGQVAGLRDLPDGEKGGFVKVQRATSGNVVHRLHETSNSIGAGRVSPFRQKKLNAGSSTPLRFAQNDRAWAGDGAPRFHFRRAALALRGL